MNTSLNKSIDENTSPVPTGNMSNMMKNWLSKGSATKKPATNESKPPIKTLDSNTQKINEKTTAHKETKHETSKTETKSLEKFEKKTSNKVETKATKTEKSGGKASYPGE
jgi:hypothetical protein